MNNWLAKLKVGDRVIVNTLALGGYGKYIGVIERITPSGMFGVYYGNTSDLFNKDGYRRGESGWNRTSLQEATDELVAEVARNRMIDRLKKVNWEEYDAELLDCVLGTISQAKKVPAS